MRKKLVWWIFISYLLIIVFSLWAITWYGSKSFREFHIQQTASDLESLAVMAQFLVDGRYLPEDLPVVDEICKRTGAKTDTRFTVILPSGIVLGDSEKDPRKMDDHSGRPEVRQAMENRLGMSTRYSDTIKKEMMYVAVPVKSDARIIAVVRTSMPLHTIAQPLRFISGKLVISGIIVFILATALSLFVVSMINRPIRQMKEGAKRFADGDLSYRLHVPNLVEFGALADLMNKMASQLEMRLDTITRQRNELDAVLSAMVEAVLVVDEDRRIIRFNIAAGQLFDVDPDKAEGESIEEITRNKDLLHMLDRLYECGANMQQDIVFENGGKQYLQAQCTFIRDAQNKNLGALFVLHNVTQQKHLESVRRDFVANVSHELRTPITAIKGSLETLASAITDGPESAGKFMDILARHADRLNQIIDDLLSLSQIERGEERKEIEMRDADLLSVLQSAARICETKANERQITIDMQCDPGLIAKVNPPLLEEAVINLIDNAVKYSDPQSTVSVNVENDTKEFFIRVSDTGRGIPQGDQARIFERFYRVDKARSRKLGGSGLGLSIVKHIVSSHHGSVEVESTMGKGSTFTIRIPV